MPFLNKHMLFSPIRLIWGVAGILGVVGIVAVWWHSVGRPALAARASLKQQLADMDVLRSAETELRTQLTHITAEAEHWRSQELQRRARVSPENDEAGFLQWLNQQAQACGLEVQDYRPSSREVQGKFDGHGIMLAAHGSYEGIAGLMDRLRACPRMNRVTSMEVSPRDAERTSYSLSLSLLLFSCAPTSAIASSQGAVR